MVSLVARKQRIAVLVWRVALPPILLRCLEHVAFVCNLCDERNDLLLLLLQCAFSGESGVLEHGLLEGLVRVYLGGGEESFKEGRVQDTCYVCCC